jgi:F-type H+-transporting ATPase subunit b
MEALLTPAFGTVVWSTIAFLVVLFLLRKMAWGPILQALKEREESIANALNEADKARSEMAELHASNDKLLQEARAERDSMLRDAREIADKMVADAKSKAKDEASREADNARQAIAVERKGRSGGAQGRGGQVVGEHCRAVDPNGACFFRQTGGARGQTH